MSRTSSPVSQDEGHVLEKYGDELQEAAQGGDANPTVVVLAAMARGERAPEWALKRMEARV